MNHEEIRTSVDVELNSLEISTSYAEENNMTISEVMNIVLDDYVKKIANKPERFNRPLMYQERGTRYKSVHIRLSFISYSKLRDVMMLFRYSLSYLLSLAMEFFKTAMKKSQNQFNRPSFHCLIVSDVPGPKYFLNYWQFPPLELITDFAPDDAGQEARDS